MLAKSFLQVHFTKWHISDMSLTILTYNGLSHDVGYHIVGKFSREKVWQIWWIIQTKTIQIPHLKLQYFLAESIHSPNFFTICLKLVNSPNFFPAKLSHYTILHDVGYIWSNLRLKLCYVFVKCGYHPSQYPSPVGMYVLFLACDTNAQLVLQNVELFSQRLPPILQWYMKYLFRKEISLAVVLCTKFITISSIHNVQWLFPQRLHATLISKWLDPTEWQAFQKQSDQ